MLKVEASIQIRIIAPSKSGPMATVTLSASEERNAIDYGTAFKMAKDMERKYYNNNLTEQSLSDCPVEGVVE